MPTFKIPSGACFLALLALAGTTYAANLSKMDKNFMTTAARTDMIEAHEGQMAENQAVRADVKDLAQTVVKDHTGDYEQLSALSTKTGIAIPEGINVAKSPAMQLVRLKGDRFDHQFVADEISTDRQALAMFKREAAHGTDPDVKDYAAKTVPMLEKELQTAENSSKPTKRS